MNLTFLVFLSLMPPGTAAFHTPPSSSVARIGDAAAVGGTPPPPAALRAPPVGRGETNDAVAARGTRRVEYVCEARRPFLVRSLSTLGRGGGAAAAAVILATTARPPVSRAAGSSPSSSATTDLASYDDADYGFRLRFPSSWERTEQTLSGRRRAVFFTDPSSSRDDDGGVSSGVVETLGFVAYTPVRDDFVSLASFGSVDEVGQATILPKGELAGGNATPSRMISATSGRGAYFFDYVAEPVVPAGPGAGVLTTTLKPQHFRTIFTLLPPAGNASAGMTLITVTLQTSEERYADAKVTFDRIIDSYEKIK
ncbi:hypothetical protein ACHAW5_009058 [Stephanodiscus triporus]|uniref:PsbP C-terminal domain-containing protein n=1 Tax=Stephanodiscus triporus TaxID=2934178 RepID=A0ABD3P9A5_9STRA